MTICVFPAQCVFVGLTELHRAMDKGVDSGK